METRNFSSMLIHYSSWSICWLLQLIQPNKSKLVSYSGYLQNRVFFYNRQLGIASVKLIYTFYHRCMSNSFSVPFDIELDLLEVSYCFSFPFNQKNFAQSIFAHQVKAISRKIKSVDGSCKAVKSFVRDKPGIF